MDDTSWTHALAVNLTAQQQLLKLAIPYLERGIDPAIVAIGSKNVAAPGPGAGAYSVSKAGFNQLMRLAALELAPSGIRVNVVHPDAVFDTGLWTDEVIARRAESYGLSVEDCKRRNLLRTSITSDDVAAVVLALCTSAFGKTTGAQIPVDGGNERVI
jgi:NAD(P)-dependent dehydrogenase (short-subunit alcohol dehydrogenase family)